MIKIITVSKVSTFNQLVTMYTVSQKSSPFIFVITR